MKLMMIGTILVSLAGLWMLVLAFKQSIGWGLACLFLPLALVVFTFKCWRSSARTFAMILIGSGLVLIGSVMAEGRGGQRDVEGEWLAEDGSMVVMIADKGVIVSVADGTQGKWKRQDRDSFLVESFTRYSGGNYDAKQDVMSLSWTGTGRQGVWVRRIKFTRIADENRSRADEVLAILKSSQ